MILRKTLFGAVCLLACLVFAGEGDEVRDEPLDPTPPQAEWERNGSFIEQQANKNLVFTTCGNGFHHDGELCFHSPVQVSLTGDPFDFIDLDVGYMNGGSNLDFVTARASNDSMYARLGSGNGSFYAYYSYTLGTDLSRVSMGDFNGDGKTDVIGTDRDQDRVYIRWGHSTWSTYSWYGVGNGPTNVAVGDLNNDGLDDFVTANAYSTSFTVGIRANGTFNRTTVHNNDLINNVGLADLNNDGYLDLVCTEGNEAVARLNYGNGSFGGRRPIDLGTVPAGVQDFVLGDFNNDGDIDMIATYYYNASLVRVLGNGNGYFGNRATASVGMLPHCLNTHDMDMDGNLDLLVGGASGIKIFLGAGNGNLAAPKTYPGTLVNAVDAGDFNGDGSPDLINITNITGGKTAIMLRLANP